MEHEPTPEEINVRYRFGAYLASETLPFGPLRMFEFAEVPPEEWQPGRHRSEWDQKEVEKVIDKALWVRTDAATPEQLRRALAFQLWQMGPDVERVAMLTALLKRT